jgi:hypothetical protein
LNEDAGAADATRGLRKQGKESDRTVVRLKEAHMR